jgi:hypothetical protein
VLDALEALHVRHYVGGSLASSAHRVPRASIDADIMADLRPGDAAPFGAALGDRYYVSEDRVRDAVQRRGSFNLIHLGTMLKVDVFAAKDRPFDRRALSRARPEPLDAPGGRSVPLATAEDIILAKLEWYPRRGGEVSERQWADVLGVMRVRRERLDLAYLRELAADLAVSDLLERALAS